MFDLNSAIDVHVHAGPSFFNRKADPIALAKAYVEEGVGGFVLKSHFGNTHGAAVIARNRVDRASIYSSMTLNSFVGGFNPTAVEYALATDARVVWLPTFSAANFDPGGIGREFPFSNQNLHVLGPNGSVKPSVIDVVETVADAGRDIVLGNGHISSEETFAILDLIENRGYAIPYLITHADFPFMGLSIEDQAQLATRGAVIEKCYLPVVNGNITPSAVIESIDTIGPDNCVLSTDHGQAENLSPPKAYREFVDELYDGGLADEDIHRMIKNATRLVDGT